MASFTGIMPPRATGARAMAELLGAAGEAVATTARSVAAAAVDAATAAATAYPPLMGTPMEVSF